MFIYHCFILLTIIILTKQIELSLSLDLLSSSLTPISYIRSSLIKDIRGSHYPAFYYSSDTEYDMSKDQHYIFCNGHYSL